MNESQPLKSSNQVQQADNHQPEIIFVVSLSGAGRNTALNIFEDFGYRRVENIPLWLLPTLLENPNGQKLAIGFGAIEEEEYRQLSEVFSNINETEKNILVYLEASDQILARRYSTTRRRHPCSAEDSLSEGIKRERKFLKELADTATYSIDTTELSPHDLKAKLIALFNLSHKNKFRVFIQSFSYKNGIPEDADMVFDCRFLRNPHWDENLRAGDGRQEDVVAYIQEDKNFSKFKNDIETFMEYIIPAVQNEGRSYFTLAFGCSGGRHRSVCLAESTAKHLLNRGQEIRLSHRELIST